MKKITLLLSLLFCIIGIGKTFAAASPITNVANTTKIEAATALDVTKVYMIFSSDGEHARGVLCCTENGNNLTRCGASSKTDSRAVSATDPYQQFVFVPYLGKYYLYNVGKKKFCKDVGETAEMTDAVGQAQYVTVTANTTGTTTGTTFLIKFNGTDQIALSDKNNTGVYPSTAADIDAGTRLYIAAVDDVTFTTEQFNEAFNKLLSMKSATLYPQDGKAYRIKARYNSTTTEFRYLYQGSTRLSLSNTTKTNNSDIFICRVNRDGTYSFVTNSGKWLVYYADGKNGAGNTTNGLAATYELGTYDATWNLSVNMAPTHTGLTTTGEKQLNLYGTVRMQGRNTSDNNNYYLLAGQTTSNEETDKNFHNSQATDTYFQTALSSFFVFEEVTDYPNKPTMTACDNIETGKKIATFSAPFPTIVPTGLSAYIISSKSTQSAHMEAIATSGQVIPANTGVLLFGETAESTVTMKPATTEGTGNSFTSTNLLAHSAGASRTISASDNAYILASGTSGIAFYTCTSGMLAMNKSYLQISGGSTNGKAFTLTLGGESTGLQTIGNDLWNNNAPIYDLSGRRVMHPAKGGVYIQNGRKFINK
ncbi:MAG: hypothetical protein ACI3X8_07150 [Alloprevotella sp.]